MQNYHSQISQQAASKCDECALHVIDQKEARRAKHIGGPFFGLFTTLLSKKAELKSERSAAATKLPDWVSLAAKVVSTVGVSHTFDGSKVTDRRCL